jgi:hypothetical protein
MGCLLRERAFVVQRAEDLVGRNVHEPAGLTSGSLEPSPARRRRREKRVRADYVRPHEFRGPVDRPVDVRLRRDLNPSLEATDEVRLPLPALMHVCAVEALCPGFDPVVNPAVSARTRPSAS